MEYNGSPIALNCKDVDFTRLKEVPEESIEAKLYSLLDDIDTATDIYKPEMKGFTGYALKKIRESHKLIISDGYKLYYYKPQEVE